MCWQCVENVLFYCILLLKLSYKYKISFLYYAWFYTRIFKKVIKQKSLVELFPIATHTLHQVFKEATYLMIVLSKKKYAS